MGGRIYDASLGRFLQADPIVQAPNNSQSYNRFAYAFNNPMTFTDPSGYSAWTDFRDKIIKPIVAIVISIYMPMYTQLAFGWGATASYAAAGFVSGAIATGSLRGATLGAFTLGVGSYGTTAGMMAGGISNHLSGGKFGHGFASALVSAKFGGMGKGITKVITSAVIAGTVSKLTGGKFANGAWMAAFAAVMTTDWSSNLKKNTGQSVSREEFKSEIDATLKEINASLAEYQKTNTFSTTDDAADWLHKNANSLAVKYDVEIGANIFKTDTNGYQLGNVVTDYQSGVVNIGRSSHRVFERKAADWHSHGKTDPVYWKREFSRIDIRHADNYPSYASVPQHSRYLLIKSINNNNTSGCIVGTIGC